MRRRRLLGATAAAFSIPLVAGCSRDDGGDDGGGSGPYGMVGAGEPAAAVGPTGAEPDARRTGVPAARNGPAGPDEPDAVDEQVEVAARAEDG